MHDSAQVRRALQARNYKKGRVSQLIRLTRPVVESAEQLERPARSSASGLGGENKDEGVGRVLQEVAEDERLSEEVRGLPGILQDREQAEEEFFQDAELQDLPRLYGKQPPRGAWSHVVAPAWVKEILALFPEPGAEEDLAEEPDEGPGRKKPRKMWPNETCPGRSPTEPCRFTQRATDLGQPACLTKGEATCKFCDREKLNACFAVPQQRKFVTRACRVRQAAGRDDVVQAAMELMTEEQKALLEKALARPSRAAAAVEARAVAKAEAEAWEKLLEERRPSGIPPTEEQEKHYRQKKADDRRRLRSKFGPLVEAKAMEDNSWRSPLATSMEEWCQEFAWRTCKSCHRMVTAPLHESNLTGKQGRKSKVVQKCSHCSKGIGYPTVSPEDIPEVLRNLTENVLWALRPLEPDVGPVAKARHGYRVHTDMIRFWWRPQTVEERLAMLWRMRKNVVSLGVLISIWLLIPRAPMADLWLCTRSFCGAIMLRSKWTNVACNYLDVLWRRKAWSVLCGPICTPRRPGAKPTFACKISGAKKADTVEPGGAEEHNKQPRPHGREEVAAAPPQSPTAAAAVLQRRLAPQQEAHKQRRQKQRPQPRRQRQTVRTRQKRLRRCTLPEKAATPQRALTWPKSLAPHLGLGMARPMSSFSLCTICGCGRPWAQRRTQWRPQCGWPWPDTVSHQSTGKADTLDWWTWSDIWDCQRCF